MKSKAQKRLEAGMREADRSEYELQDTCQKCKYHKNKPSRCPFYGFVGRKDVGCSDFRS